MIQAQFNITSFLENGALLKLSSDQFNLISGPFSLVPLCEDQMHAKVPLIYQPYFWDFLQVHRQTLFGSKGVSSHILTRQQLLALLIEQQPKKPKMRWKTLETQAFREQFDWSQQEFAQHKLQKTVPIVCQKSETHLSSQNRAWMLFNLLTEELSGWTYGFWENGSGYLGQTPELIVEWNLENQVLKTSAVAGTLTNTSENELQILQDSKIREEHNFVVSDISNQLKEVLSEEKIQRLETHVQKLKHLLHLKTDFQCSKVSFVEAVNVLQKLHPTAALGIYPRELSEMQRFSKLKLQDQRNTFAAPFALMTSEKVLCVAAIRNLFFSETEIRIFSGCGVTTESHFETEWGELQMKRDSVKKMMGLFE